MYSSQIKGTCASIKSLFIATLSKPDTAVISHQILLKKAIIMIMHAWTHTDKIITIITVTLVVTLKYN